VALRFLPFRHSAGYIAGRFKNNNMGIDARRLWVIGAVVTGRPPDDSAAGNTAAARMLSNYKHTGWRIQGTCIRSETSCRLPKSGQDFTQAADNSQNNMWQRGEEGVSFSRRAYQFMVDSGSKSIKLRGCVPVLIHSDD
jgi:hypothetical protein